MSDPLASIAQAYLAMHPDAVARLSGDRQLYAFLSKHYPNLELTPKTIRRLRWSIAMNSVRSQDDV